MILKIDPRLSPLSFVYLVPTLYTYTFFLSIITKDYLSLCNFHQIAVLEYEKVGVKLGMAEDV